MRRTQILIVALLLTGSAVRAEAQDYAIDRGSILLGGAANFTSIGDNGGDSDRVTDLNIFGRSQYFVRPGLAVGGRISLDWFSSAAASRTSYGVGPEVSYYFGGGDRDFYPFVSGFATATRWDGSGLALPDACTVFDLGASGGVLLMLGRSVGLTGQVYYQTSLYDSDALTATNRFGFSAGITPFIF